MLEYKNYYIKNDGKGLYLISNVGKGVLPNYLKGLYTSKQFAMKRVDEYVEAKNGKTDSGS